MKMKKSSTPVFARRYVYNQHYHLVWATANRKKFFSNVDSKTELKKILKNIADVNKIDIEQLSIHDNYVQLLISFTPSNSPVKVISTLKGRSAALFLKKHPELKTDNSWIGHLWSSSYYLGTIGNFDELEVTNFLNDTKYNKTIE